MKTRHEISAGGVLVRGEGASLEILLAARRTRGGDLVWGLPKGLIEPGETPEAAAIREVREETGWEGAIREPLGDIEYWFVWEGTRIRKRVHFFLMEALRGDPEARDHEMELVEWYAPEAAVPLVAYETEREIVERGLARS